MKHLTAFVVFFCLALPIAVLPYRLSIAAGRFMGALAYRLWGSRRRVALDNVMGAIERGALDPGLDPDSLIRENFGNMGMYLAEVVKVFFGLGDRIINSISVVGEENYRRAKDRGRGVIFFSGHCGNWELITLAMSSKVDKLWGVARKQSNPYMNGFIVRARERYGSSIVYKQGALRKFMSVLKDGGTVGVLIDQSVLPEEGVLVDFLGAPAWTTRMPAALARRTGAALVPAFISSTPEGRRINILPEVELEGDDAADTERLSSRVEDYIRENPAEWLWIHRRWKRADAVQGGERA